MKTSLQQFSLESTERRARAWLLAASAVGLAAGAGYRVVSGPGPHDLMFSLALGFAFLVSGGISFVAVIVPWTQRLAERLSLRQLQWVTTLLPAAAILAIDAAFYVTHRFGVLSHVQEHTVFAGVLLAASVPFCLFVFDVFRRIQREMVAKNERIAIMEERERIAREMHDNFGQVLGYINTKAQAARLMGEEGQTERARAQIIQLSDSTRELYGDVRDAILGLRSTAFLDEGLVAALDLYARQFAEQTGIVTSFDACPAAERITLGPEVEVQIFRIVQEALANVRKHSGATRARVFVTSADGVTEILVEDKGNGFDPAAISEQTPRFGLHSMRERATAIGGEFSIDAEPGGGTRVVLRLPTRARRTAK